MSREILSKMLKEAAGLTLDIEKGDVLLGGKYKNSPITVEDIGTDELGQPTVNGKKLLAFRIKKKMPKTAGAPLGPLERILSKITDPKMREVFTKLYHSNEKLRAAGTQGIKRTPWGSRIPANKADTLVNR